MRAAYRICTTARRADNDRLGFNRSATGLKHLLDQLSTVVWRRKVTPKALGQVGRHLRDSVARFYPHLMRTVERAVKFMRPQSGAILVEFVRLN